MSDIEELQRRITAAMDRVASGLDRLGPRDTGPDRETMAQLEEERAANAELTERLRTLKLRADAEAADRQSHLQEAQARIAQLDTELQRVRLANAELTEACAALQDANAEGVGDAHLINKAMLAELEGLRAARAAEVAESSAILAALMPLIEDGAIEANAREGS